MTEKDLIAKRLAGMGYKELARISGMKEMTVWKLLKGKVPGKARSTAKKASRDPLVSLTGRIRIQTGGSTEAPLEGASVTTRGAKKRRSGLRGVTAGPETMDAYIARTGWNGKAFPGPMLQSKKHTKRHPYVQALYRLIAQSALMTDEEFDLLKAELQKKFRIGAAVVDAKAADISYAESPASYHGDNKPRRP